MEAKEILTKIKQLFADLTAPVAAAAPAAPEAVLPTEYELKDGGKVMIDKLEVGGIVMVDGAAALPGDLELADGTKLTVADNGVISEMVAAEVIADEPPAMEDMSTPAAMQIALSKFADISAPDTDIKKMAVILKACFENVFGWQIREAQEKATRDAAIEVYKSGFSVHEEKIKKQQSIIEQLLTLSQLIVDAPAAAPDAAAKTSNNFKEEKQTYSPILFN